MCDYTDDSVCEENMYCRKSIDAPIKCGVCEHLKFDNEILEGITMYACKEQNPNCYRGNIKKLYKFCPLKQSWGVSQNSSKTITEPIRCASCDKLRCENTKLKEENEQLETQFNQAMMLVDNVQNHRNKIQSDLQSEIESLKKNQLSKDEIDYINIWFKHFIKTVGMDSETRIAMNKLDAKLQSMGDET